MSAPGKSTQPSSMAVIAAFGAIYIIWGSTYFAILFAIKDIPPFMMAAIRFITAGLLLFTYARLRGEKAPDLLSASRISAAGILMLFMGTGAVAWSEQYISSGIASIIVATVPLWFVLLDKKQWGFYFSSRWIMGGLLLGFAGVIVLLADRQLLDFSGNPMKVVSMIVLTCGSITWSIGSLYSKYKPVAASASMKAAIQMTAAGICSLVTSLIVGEQHFFSIRNVSANAWLALGYLITFGSLIGYMSYVWLLNIKPPSLVGTYAYVNPVVAVFLGWLFVGEKITWQQTIALAIILGGVILVNLSREKKVPEAAPAEKKEVPVTE
ncbi:EamA family transporter [Nostoc ellipsosporum NOK]|nr:EamA family transporter [Nostoc ellipsosporum NOK]